MNEASQGSFDHLSISPRVLSVLDRLKFKVPTPIQYKSIPLAIEGVDLVGIAQTVTGKTLAFGIPMIQRIAATGTRGLVLVPTRELALQVLEALRPFLRAHGMKGAAVIGGSPMNPQIQALKKKPDVIIATPGRLNDFIRQKVAKIEDVSILVLDEADRMFDMGFQPQVEAVMRSLPGRSQTLLFSATMPEKIMRLVAKHMKLPARVEIAPSGTSAEQIVQELFIVKEQAKLTLLRGLLSEYRGSVLLFIRTRSRAAQICRALHQMKETPAEIHSDRSMGQRKQAVEGFKSGKYRILVATDIASRGIDVKGIELVINYDLPDEIENYVHRVGRTGRAGHSGFAVTFATPTQAAEIHKIETLIKKKLIRKTHPGVPGAEFHGGHVVPDSRSLGPRRRPYGSLRRRR